MDYLQISFTDLQPEQKDILVAQLAEAGFEGFEESETGLEAFIRKEVFDEALFNEIIFKYQLSFTKKLLTDKNWNQIWESSFHPIVMGDYVSVRAGFHSPVPGTQHEIIIAIHFE